MKKNSVVRLFEKAGLSIETINQFAVLTGFIKRSRKIKAVEFLVFMITESVRGCVSCNDLAASIDFKSGTTVRRQAYHKKMGWASLHFFEAILARILQAKTTTALPSPFRKFKRILVQDSTVVKLPEKLMAIFSGVKNRDKQACNARVQCTYDLLAGAFTHWTLHAYSKNDLAS